MFCLIKEVKCKMDLLELHLFWQISVKHFASQGTLHQCFSIILGVSTKVKAYLVASRDIKVVQLTHSIRLP